ncbi:MAG TPA: winged helix-turn-helix domain-containing protein [Candidatus Sulfotelmatobacter sp.]|nr:winged helix-turn-helix domain-containing protein [Candidatus Sulfotelmatobacter sp.]
MASPLPASPKIKFGAFELDASAARLFKSGIPIKLQPQPLRVLLLLTERPGQVVTREEIQRCLWGDSTFVDFERGINFSINQIRVALSDNAEKPRYIETLPRVGYRFIAPVSSDGASQPALASAAPILSSGRLYDWPAESKTVVAGAPEASEISSSRWKRIYALSIAAAAIMALMAVYGVQRWWPRNRSLDIQNVQITKLTDSGEIRDVAISPDGRYVIYAQGGGEKEGLRLRQITTHSDVQILQPQGGSFHGLTFSPDGNYVYFVRADPKDLFFKYLYVMPTLGGAARKLFTDVDSPVSFSPDGRQFAYERCVAADNHIEIRIANVDGNSDASVATIRSVSCFMYQAGLSWSPDGRVLAIPLKHFGKPERWVVHILSLANGTVRDLYASPSSFGRPAWLPEGKTLLLPHYDENAHRSQLWTISYPDGEARRLTNDLNNYDVAMDMTRNGETVVAVAGSTTSNVWLYPGADSARGRQITSGNLPMFDVAQSPDGRILSTSGDGEIWVANAGGNQQHALVGIQDAGWLTPCGQVIVLASFGPGVVTLMRVAADGSNPTKLSDGSLWSPACSPDGRFVFYVNVDSPQKVWRVPVEGGKPVEIAVVLGDDISGRLSVSPDGQFLAYPYTRYSSSAGPGWNLTIIPAAGGSAVKRFDVPVGFSGTRWSPQGEGLVYALTQNGTSNLWEQPVAGGAPKQITRFTSGLIFDFNWTADGKQLLLTRGSVSSDVILLNNLH